MTEFEAEIIETERSNPSSVELARWVCLAARIEPALLRKARLRHMPSAAASVEADLWFGPLVQTRGSQAIVFYPEVSARLRRELVGGIDLGRPNHPDPEVRQRTARLLAARDLVREVHRHPPRPTERDPYNLLQLEEELTWLSLVRTGDELEREVDAIFRPLIKAIVAEHREGLGRWALSVLPHLPAEARTKTARLLQAISESRLYGGWISLDPGAGAQLSEEDRNLLLLGMERTAVGVRLSSDTLELSAPPAEGSQKIDVPATAPLSLDVAWTDGTSKHERHVEWEEGASAVVIGAAVPVSITTQAGDNYNVVRQEEIVNSLRKRLRSSVVCLLDNQGLVVGIGLFVGRTSMLVARQTFASLSARRTDAEGRGQMLLLLPFLDEWKNYELEVNYVLDAAKHSADEFVRIELTDPRLASLDAPAFGPAAEAVRKSCTALSFTPQNPQGDWLQVEVQEARADGTHGVRVLTEVAGLRMKFWAGAPVVNTSDGRVVGVLHFRPTPGDAPQLTPYLTPNELLGVAEREDSRGMTPRIFVSSTWLDLQPEREAVEKALQRLRASDFVGMEYFGSRDEDTRRISLHEVDRSQAYVGIFAARYGSGITEDEYRRARELNLPCLIYFKAESAITFDKVEQDPAQRERLAKLKAELLKAHTVSDFSNPDELAAKVTADLSRWILDEYQKQAGVTGRDYPAINALHQLPPPPADFTGRAEELAELMSKIDQGGVTISGLQGQGGIGKTALALKLAEQLTPHYPDAQLYLDLRGADEQQPLSPSDALSHVLRAYHPTAKLPEGEADLRALYLATLHGQRALLLMDNARDATQVQPLIPPVGCLLLVTSRQHFILPGLYAKDLDTLPPDDARALLLNIAPRIGEHADEMARLCGYLPLALRLAASALAERRGISPAEYITRLSDERQRLRVLGGIEASIKLSYDMLSAELQRLWRALSVAPATFDDAAAAAVWETDLNTAQDALGELLKYSMLDWDDATARYRQHDLLRLFAVARLEDAAGYASQLRQAKHYLDVLKRAEHLYMSGGESVIVGIEIFDTERFNIHEGRAWAAAHMDDLTHAALCRDYPLAAPYLLDLRLAPRERIDWLEVGISAARRLGDRSAEVAHLANLGVAYEQLGDPRRAVELFEQALVIWRELDDRRGEGYALNGLGIAYTRLGEPRRAAEFHEQALIIAREIGDTLGESNALRNLGIAYKNLGEMARAFDLFEHALSIMREIGYRRGEGEIYFQRSLAREQMGDSAMAVAEAEAALRVFEQLKDPLASEVAESLERWRAGS